LLPQTRHVLGQDVVAGNLVPQNEQWEFFFRMVPSCGKRLI
jgi:hypothetical protein